MFGVLHSRNGQPLMFYTALEGENYRQRFPMAFPFSTLPKQATASVYTLVEGGNYRQFDFMLFQLSTANRQSRSFNLSLEVGNYRHLHDVQCSTSQRRTTAHIFMYFWKRKPIANFVTWFSVFDITETGHRSI